MTRNGARLMLVFDARRYAFVGSVRNVTDKILDRVRVEVHLSNGKELGPTEPVDLGPGESKTIVMTVAEGDFRALDRPSRGGSRRARSRYRARARRRGRE